jgi:DNA polymerase IV
MRTILHLDMNSYFATAEQQANPLLRGRPVGVVKAEGRGCVIAASMEAKKFGVKTGMTVWEARKLCPMIIFVPSDMDKYESLTGRLIKIVKRYSPAVEVFSIDEMFADMTESQLIFSGGVWEMAMEIKWQIKKELGEWMKCSIGIAFNKVTAKLASEMDKPDGLTFLTPENCIEKTNRVVVGEVCGIGRARTRWLQERGAYTLEQARQLELPEELADLIWLRDEAKLTTEEDLQPAKSVSRTYTGYRELQKESEVARLVRNLIEEATGKLREMGRRGRTVCLALSSDEGLSFWARRTVKSPIDDGQIVFELLWKEYLVCPLPGVRFAGVGISNLTEDNQLLIWPQKDELLKAVDRVNYKFGLFTLYPARLLGGELIRPEITGFFGDKWYRLKERKISS